MQSKEDVLRRMKSLATPEYLKGMGRFRINTEKALGVSIPHLRSLAREIGKSHELAQELWSSEIHEARILATMIDDVLKVTDKQMEEWVKDFDSWDLCDQCIGNLFCRTKGAYGKAVIWSGREEEFVRRAGYAMMAYLAVHDKKASDERFLEFLSNIEQDSIDERNFVKKAVNWALRQIGKRNPSLNKKAIHSAKEVQRKDSKAARWIAADALRELTSAKLLEQLSKTKRGAS
jgi:3-methyladenine DNA glycosylase AlkD